MQVGFSPDDVNSVIKDSLDAVLANQQYSEVKVKSGQLHHVVAGVLYRACTLSSP
jgi:hypothetical protein